MARSGTFDGRQVVSRQLEQAAFARQSGERIVLRDLWALKGVMPVELADGGGPKQELEVPLLAMVLGVDAFPRALSRTEVEPFGDFFTQNLLLRGAAPLTLRALVEAFDALPGEARLGTRDVFAVAEGAAVLGRDPEFEVNGRLVIVWRRDESSKPDVMLSTVASLDDPSSLMQLAAWSESEGAFHYFERSRDGYGWIWAGNSFHALKRPSRGRGPFDSHINGSLVMKELKEPWAHWRSMAASFTPDTLIADPATRTDPLFARFSGGEDLELIVRQGVRRWTKRRLATESTRGTLEHFHRYARHLVAATSVNLVSSKVAADAIAGLDAVDLPASFFFDVDGFNISLGALSPDGDAPDHALPTLSVSGALYRDALHQLGAHVTDSNGRRVEGDGHFAFTVPERAFEDVFIVTELLQRGIVSGRLAMSLLLVDYSNPVSSKRREALLRHFPEVLRVQSGAADLDRAFVASVAQSSGVGSPQEEFLSYWNRGNKLAAFAGVQRDAFFGAVQQQLDRPGGALALVRLAESRRAAFRRRPLDEFPQIVPTVDVVVPPLRMRANGTVGPQEEEM